VAAWTLGLATGFEARAPRSVLTLLFRPGRLTRDFLDGRRARHVSPVQLYLWCTAAFFLLHAYAPFVRLDRRSGAVVSTLSALSIGTRLSDATLGRLAAQGVSLAEFAPRFDAAVSAYLPLLLVGLVVGTIGILAVLFRRATALAHAVFALHWTAFYFLLETLRQLAPLPRDWGISASVVTAAMALVYLAAAVRVAYGRSWGRSLAGALVTFVFFVALLGAWLSSTSLLGERLA